MKLINSNYDKETGVSIATITTKDCGDFIGTAILNSEDKEYASRYIGCEIAELRAIQKYFKTKIKRLNIQLQILYKIQKEIKKEYKDKILDKEILVLQEQKNDLKKEIKNINNTINNIAEKHIENVKLFNKKIKEKQDN